MGWGVGGIEAEAVMLGQPYFMLIPEVVGMKLIGALPLGTTATDLVLTATQILRKKGVVDKFVEFYGPGLSSLGLADRATIANMAPEYGATMGFFPVDAETLRYLERTGRSRDRGGSGRALLQGAGALPHRCHPGSRVQHHAGARSLQHRPQPRRPEAPAGPGAAHRAEAQFHREPAGIDESHGAGDAQGAGGERVLAVGGRGRRQRHHRRARGRGGGHRARPRCPAGRFGRARRRATSPSTTVPSSSPRSPAAPIPPIRR